MDKKISYRNEYGNEKETSIQFLGETPQSIIRVYLLYYDA